MYSSSQSADTGTHHRRSLRAHRDGSGGAIAEVCPWTRTHLGDHRLCNRYPEAIPLRKATAKAIANELFLLSS
ncbi:hypothetical protein QQF64_000344 [Cirrhinus molitorella]|uniref:Uncharacterized protein n=1 Tax=Cirrhinus molitorella TaxID=172907 RepID=A0ABR3NY81_9TELE